MDKTEYFVFFKVKISNSIYDLEFAYHRFLQITRLKICNRFFLFVKADQTLPLLFISL